MATTVLPKDETVLGGRYLLQQEIGSGGAGTVYRATDLRTGGPVAVKLLHRAYARNATYRKRLRREAQIAAALTSPRVVRIMDLDEDGDVLFLVEEYVAGETLGERLRRVGRLPLREALEIGREVGCALAAAHAARIEHRDLKPDNVKLVDGQVKVLDFGIARADGIPGLTTSDTWVGTVEYVAPERAQGLGDIRSDLYSLGVMLFALVTGRLPFVGPTPLAILRQHESTPPPIPDDLPPLVRTILARSLAKRPDQRYQSPIEMVEELDRALDRMGGTKPPHLPWSPGLQWEERSDSGRTADEIKSAVLPFDPFRTARTPKVIPPHNLPVQVTSFVGRERECAQLHSLLPTVRALTLTGPGGIGKTRLALQVAGHAVEQYRDGAWVIDLTGLPSSERLTLTVAGTLGVLEEPGRELVDTLVEWLRPRHLLLVLDNCEHLITACAAMVDTLLQACPYLSVLATSREQLGIPGEAVWRVPPLDMRSEAIQLFSERATAAIPDFAIGPESAPMVAEICRRLDGLPLAIELAAARVNVLSVAEITDRLNDRFHLLTASGRSPPHHHQTLRAALDWSYGLLSDREQVLFQRLAVFAHGCTLEAAEAVIPDQASEGDITTHGRTVWPPHAAVHYAKEAVLDGLAALVDKSLLAHETGADGRSRYTMLGTIREYALERLRADAAEEDVAMRHLDYCTRLAERAEPALRGQEQLSWLARLDAEHENLRAVLDWCADDGASPKAAAMPGLRLAAALGWYWYLRGLRSEGRRRMKWLLQRAAAVDPAGADGPDGPGAKARAVAAHLVFWGPDPAASLPLADEACRVARATGDPLTLAWCLLYRAVVEPRRTDTGEWAARWAEALALFQANSDRWGVALCLAWLGRFALRDGHTTLAQQHLEESHSLFRGIGDRWGMALALARLASVAEQVGDLARAEANLEEQQQLAQELGHRGAVAGGLSRLAGLSLRRGDVSQAAERFERSIATFRAIGETRSTAAPLRQLARLVAHHRADYSGAESLLGESLRVWQDADGLAGPIRSLLGYADVALLQGQSDRSARLIVAAEAEMARSKAELDGTVSTELEMDIVALRHALLCGGDDPCATASPLPLADAIQYALQGRN